MSIPQFEVVLKGVSAGFDAQQAQSDFAALFSLSAEKVSRLFAARRTVLKTGIDQETASKYVARLARIGVETSAEEISSAPAEETISSPTITAESQPLVEVTEQSQASLNSQTEEVAEEMSQEINPPSLSAPAEDEPAQHSEPEPPQNAAAIVEPVLPFGEEVQQPDAVAEETLEIPVNASVESVKHPFEFTGVGFEYFKIWIVNLLLNILTIGIYSAWAKVRNKQYFYGNTHVADVSFEYTAEPIKILKGRIIAFALYAGMVFSGHISPIASLVFSLAFLIFLPWIIVSSLRFNARHTSYRNIPFRFHGSVWGALGAFLGWPLLGFLSLGLLLPLAWKKQAQYLSNNHSYGAEPFVFDVHVKEYYKVFLIMLGATVVFIVAFMALMGGTALMTGFGKGTTFDPSTMLAFIPMMVLYLAFYLGLGAYLMVSLANIHFNHTRLKAHQFTANWGWLSYIGLLVTNTLGILFTLGLFVPFAKVRTAAYKASHTALIVNGDLDTFIAHELEQSNALGEGVHDMFDIDISL